MRYFIGREGRQLGPFTEQQVRDQVAAGLVGPDDLLWREGMTDWQPVHALFGETRNPSVPPRPPLPPTSRLRSPHSFAANPGPASSTTPKLASRETRLLATSLDHLFAIVLSLPGIIQVSRALAGPMEAILLHPESPPDVEQLAVQIQSIILSALPLLALPLLFLGLVQLVLLSRRGQTLGKIICKIRVVRTNGQPAAFVHAFCLRAVLMGFIAAIPVIGWLVACVDPLLIFREDRRCLHDLIADTTVIDA